MVKHHNCHNSRIIRMFACLDFMIPRGAESHPSLRTRDWHRDEKSSAAIDCASEPHVTMAVTVSRTSATPTIAQQ